MYQPDTFQSECLAIGFTHLRARPAGLIPKLKRQSRKGSKEPLGRTPKAFESTSCKFQCAEELVRLLNGISGYEMLGFTAAPGGCRGDFYSAVMECGSVFAYETTAPVFMAGKRNLDKTAFAFAFPKEPSIAADKLVFWKNTEVANVSVTGGFCFKETQAHWKATEKAIHFGWLFNRDWFLRQLDCEENRSLYEYMCVANACQLTPKAYAAAVTFILKAVMVPTMTGFMDCPLDDLLTALKDASFQTSLPLKQLLPSTEKLLDKTKEIGALALRGGNVSELGDLVELKRTQLNAACQEAYGVEPKRFLHLLRIEHAMFLLKHRTERQKIQANRIESCYLESGFNSSTAFRKAFKEWFGLLPKEALVE